MDKASFIQQEFAKRGIGADWTYSKSSTPAEDLDGEDLSLYSYTDEEHSDDELTSEETSSRKSLAKDPSRAQLEQEFVQKYNEYMRPEKPLSRYKEQFLLEDIFILLRKLNQKWVEIKVARYRQLFSGVDEEIPLQIGSAFAYEKIVDDKQNGVYIEHALAHYLRVAQNKAIDLYFRKEFGRLPKSKKNGEDEPTSSHGKSTRSSKPHIISIEELGTSPDGQYHGDRDKKLGYNPFEDMKRPYWEREERSRQLAILYLRKLMDYEDEPQKPLAVMYGSCLFQLAKVMENDDELTQIAKASTVLSSKEWAFMKMGLMNLRELGDESEIIISQYYGAHLSWGSGFLKHMLERTEDGKAMKWADIVYTQTYTKGQTSNWIESISKSAIIKAAREIADNPDMIEFVMETLGEKNRFRMALASKTKEECK